MRTSSKGITLIKEFESLHDGDLSLIGLQPKMDPIGIWTEGWGRAMRDGKGEFIRGAENELLAYSLASINTEQEADAALVSDLGVYETIVMQKITVPLNQNQFDALVSYTYNTGGSETLFRYINRKEDDRIIRLWIENHYITANGIKLKGLVRRRKAEADLFFL